MKINFPDISRFLKTLTLRKATNFLGLILSYQWAKISKRIILFGNPANMAVEPTTSCNLHCLECPCGQNLLERPKGCIDEMLFRKAIDESYKNLLTVTLYFQGEPFMHNFFFKMIEYAKAKNIYTISSTNGHFLDDANAKRLIESGLDRLIVSLDGTTQSSYQTYRVGGNLEKVIDGVKNLVQQKKILKSKSPNIILQFLVHSKNEHQIAEAKMLAKKLKVNKIEFKTLQLTNNQQDKNNLIPEKAKYARYLKDRNENIRFKWNLANKCFRMWQSCVITWDGDIIPCCFDKNANHSMGKLNYESLKQVWRNNKYNKFRKGIFLKRRQFNICLNCTEGLK